MVADGVKRGSKEDTTITIATMVKGKTMAKKREMDNLAKDAAAALAAGMSYGKWKAMQDNSVAVKKKDEKPEDWKVCPHCGKSFKPRPKSRQIYCEAYCQQQAQAIKRSEKNRERQKQYRDRKKAEREEQAERMKLWEENRKKVQCG